ncbi:MAG: hypothetical protein IJU23_10465, partial [Proteobacteria bacterium]|nr:hypothetical protein [Pseudomonadota bacterium]
SCGMDRICCGEDQQCLNDERCAPKCDAPRVLCGTGDAEVCCPEGDVCLKDKCVKDCTSEQTRCGADQNMCCNNADQICIFNKCLTRGKSCEKTEDCELWQFCDSASHSCVDTDEDDTKCIYKPPVVDKFSPSLKWHYTGCDVEGSPVVGDMTGDGIPEVVFMNNCYQLVALKGATGEVIATNQSHIWHPWGDLAIADINNDGIVEVVIPTGEKGSNKSGLGILQLVQIDGKWQWKEIAFMKIEDSLLASNLSSDGRYYTDVHPTIADIDADGVPEVVTAVGVFKGDDLTKWQCKLNVPSYHTWYRYMVVVADLDGDNQSELIADKIYDNKCNVIANISETGWGFPAVADMMKTEGEEGELVPEIIRVGNNSVSVWKVYKKGNTWSQVLKWKKAHPGGGGGHPNIADFNGDGQADIGIAGADYYAVFSGNDGTVLWSSKTQDHSSQRTGSSVFDFEGDGKAEVVYRDEQYLRVYDGTTGKVLMQEAVTSGTVIDYPLIVDLDADGKTDILTTSASSSTKGVLAYQDSKNNWVRTRKIWNQHAYHVTNINEDGTVPQFEQPNWLNKRLNNYRANTQPDDVFNAPNFVPGDLKIEQDCPNYKLTATIKNEGSLSVKGVWVSFYIRGYDKGDGSKDDLLLGSVQLNSDLVPGGSADVTFTWDLSGTLVSSGTKVDKVTLPQELSFSVDDAPGKDGSAFFNECVEDNNDSASYSFEACKGAIN